jgi:WD40 repeat protein
MSPGRRSLPLPTPAPERVFRAALSTDLRWLATDVEFPALVLIDRSTGRRLRRFTGLRQQAHRIVFSLDGRWLAGGGASGLTRIWEVRSGRAARVLECSGAEVLDVAFSPDGRRLIITTGLGTNCLYEVATGRRLHLFRDGGWTWSAAWSPEGRWLVTSSSWGHGARAGGQVRCRDARSGRERWTVAHRHAFQVAISPRGTRVVVSGLDQTLRLLRLASGREQWRETTRRPGGALVFSPDGRLVAQAVRGAVVVRRVATGARVKAFDIGSDEIRALAFARDGRALTAVNQRGAARRWPVTGLAPPTH